MWRTTVKEVHAVMYDGIASIIYPRIQLRICCWVARIPSKTEYICKYINLILLNGFICVISSLKESQKHSSWKYLPITSPFLLEYTLLYIFTVKGCVSEIGLQFNITFGFEPCIRLCPVDLIAFLPIVVNLLYIWPSQSFILTCKCVVQLLVSSDKMPSILFSLLFNKNTPEICIITSCLMA